VGHGIGSHWQPGSSRMHLFKSQDNRNLREISFGGHKTTEQTRVLSESDVYLSFVRDAGGFVMVPPRRLARDLSTYEACQWAKPRQLFRTQASS
jgi:hypothetical protein